MITLLLDDNRIHEDERKVNFSTKLLFLVTVNKNLSSVFDCVAREFSNIDTLSSGI